MHAARDGRQQVMRFYGFPTYLLLYQMFSRPIPVKDDVVVTEKPIATRLKEVVELLGKLTGDLGIPLESPEVQELKVHLDAYVRDGICWSGKISFEAWDNRIAHVVLPKTKPIEVVLKKANKRK
jgi:hypothetical protein